MQRPAYTLVLAAILFTASAFAREEPLVDITYNKGLYATTISTSINAKPDVIYQLLTSYDHFNDFSRLIKTSKLLPNRDLLLKIETCLAFLCFEKQQTLALTLSENTITGHIIPEKSDFSSGWMEWTLSNDGGKSLIQFSSELTPDFWIPPFIGPLIIQHKLKVEALYSVKQLERLALKKYRQ